ncbi:hypothetical protein [Microbulbifer sp. GL-2]|uniref:hypothetical protein n=1 Tax=Microbulbifer sp. GL-2 TaxID=2591606 RepID=UPI001163FE45|nr:hypothetical protein [Microbulbifer sp. GL-2]BBM04017.1 hypothetical protein GL2_40910 [Microbulbifer sp. GL-2]
MSEVRFPKRHLEEIRGVAQDRLMKYLYNDAGGSNEQLAELASAISSNCYGGLKIIPGPVKGKNRALDKINKDYGGDVYDLKDLVRMTIIADNKSCLSQVRQGLIASCISRNGYGIIKNSETFPEQDPCGYSGLNFVARLPNGRAGEVQANTPNRMYGKMAKEDFEKFLGPHKYISILCKYRIEGGLGHGLYEIYRSNMGGFRKAAASLSKQYYAFLRSDNPKINSARSLQEDLTAMKLLFAHIFH